MKVKLVELQAEDGQVLKIKIKTLGRNWQDSDRILLHQSLLYVSDIIRIELISRHYDNPLEGYFGIEKTQKLITKKYYWKTLYHDVEVHIRACDIYLTSKKVRHKLHRNLQ